MFIPLMHHSIKKKKILSCSLPLPENMHEVSPCVLNANYFFTAIVDKIK
jgi:hypothetical protein